MRNKSYYLLMLLMVSCNVENSDSSRKIEGLKQELIKHKEKSDALRADRDQLEKESEERKIDEGVGYSFENPISLDSLDHRKEDFVIIFDPKHEDNVP